ncbi:amidase family protein, partial [Enterobacter hormaechei]
MRATSQSHRAYLQALERRAEIRETWATFFERYDVLLAPVTVSAAFPLD